MEGSGPPLEPPLATTSEHCSMTFSIHALSSTIWSDTSGDMIWKLAFCTTGATTDIAAVSLADKVVASLVAFVASFAASVALALARAA